MRFLLVFVVMLAGCRDLPYKPDSGYLPSAVGNSAEWPVWVQGKVCKDLDGTVGFCAVRVQAGRDIRIQTMAQQYAYTARLSCTTEVMPYPVEVTLPAGSGYTFTVPASSFINARYFNCTVLITPRDREEPVSSFSRMSLLVVAKSYVALGTPIKVDGHFVFGPNAKYVWYEDAKGTHWLKEKTYIKDSGIRRAVVESHNQRVATYGF